MTFDVGDLVYDEESGQMWRIDVKDSIKMMIPGTKMLWTEVELEQPIVVLKPAVASVKA